VFDLADSWVWDFWVVDDPSVPAPSYHLFFLHAPRSLGDPELRHVNGRVGHAVSPDLTRWTRLPDPLPPSPTGAYDDRATWTGSVVRGDDGTWRMFTSGISWAEEGRVQRIGRSTSRDLITWTRDDLVLEADPRWYHRPRGTGPDEHWRDPWLVRDDEGLWHMYVTAQVPGERGHGVVGHAVSVDLDTWEVRPPLSEPTGRFDQLEVVSLSRVEGRNVLLFSCLGTEMPLDGPGAGGVWAVPVDGPGSPVDVDAAVRLTSEDLYVGKVVTRRDGTSRFLAFENRSEDDGRFRGGVIDPVPVSWDPEGRLELLDVPDRWRP
jgi:beta-fructofuranosidase